MLLPAGAGRPICHRSASSAPGSGRARRAPASPADHALRMLLLHSEWWDALEPADHELLHALPAPHGALCAWLERHLVDHGVTPWSALAAALAGSEHAGLAEQLVTSHALADEMALRDLRHVIDGMWIEQLTAEQQRLIAAAGDDPSALERWRAVDAERRRRLRARAESAHE